MFQVAAPCASIRATFEPGNGTRYEVVYTRRHGGGWLLVWGDVGAVARVRTHPGPVWKRPAQVEAELDGQHRRPPGTPEVSLEWREPGRATEADQAALLRATRRMFWEGHLVVHNDAPAWRYGGRWGRYTEEGGA